MSLSSSKVVCSSHSDSMVPFSFLHTFKKREKQTNIDSFYVYVLYCVLGCETDEVYFVVVGKRERERERSCLCGTCSSELRNLSFSLFLSMSLSQSQSASNILFTLLWGHFHV